MSAKGALQYAEQVADVLGDQWDHTPGCQMWAACPLCHLLESVRALAEAEDAGPAEAEVQAAADAIAALLTDESAEFEADGRADLAREMEARAALKAAAEARR